MTVDSFVTGLVLLVFGGLILALRRSEVKRAQSETAALKAETKAAADKYYDNQKRLDEVISDAEQKRIEARRDLDLLKHAIWRPGGDRGRRDFDV